MGFQPTKQGRTVCCINLQVPVVQLQLTLVGALNPKLLEMRESKISCPEHESLALRAGAGFFRAAVMPDPS